MNAQLAIQFDCDLQTRVDFCGSVCTDNQVETFRCTHPTMRRDLACIELAQHTDGQWMWGVQLNATNGGFGWRVGPKWNRFAPTKSRARLEAIADLMLSLHKHGLTRQEVGKIQAWVRALS